LLNPLYHCNEFPDNVYGLESEISDQVYADIRSVRSLQIYIEP
jgi:hypothetical protein